MILNFDTRDRYNRMIQYCFDKEIWSVFYNAIVDYILNPCYGTEYAFLSQIIFIIKGTDIEIVSSYKKTDSETINKLSEIYPLGFSDMYVVRIKTEFSTYYIKFEEDYLNNVEKFLIEYIKDNYELGRIDNYIGEFVKIK